MPRPRPVSTAGRPHLRHQCPGVTERQEELLFGAGRHPDADRIERKRLGDGADPETAWLDTVLGKPVEGVKKANALHKVLPFSLTWSASRAAFSDGLSRAARGRRLWASVTAVTNSRTVRAAMAPGVRSS